MPKIMHMDKNYSGGNEIPTMIKIDVPIAGKNLSPSSDVYYGVIDFSIPSGYVAIAVAERGTVDEFSHYSLGSPSRVYIKSSKATIPDNITSLVVLCIKANLN